MGDTHRQGEVEQAGIEISLIRRGPKLSKETVGDVCITSPSWRAPWKQLNLRRRGFTCLSGEPPPAVGLARALLGAYPLWTAGRISGAR